ncbi:MAG: alanyl-tRNA editing protein, partial [Candidatus Thermoplasmatota archaeon]|nr:alanyl-tRNA editing protein [Candidatus Thermoplasmatota archaeon]
MTEILYMPSIESCYIFEFKARVLEADPASGSIVLDRTAFYPEGGGQPTDTGMMSWVEGSSKVRSIRKSDKVRHYLEGELPSTGTEVDCRIDKDIRYNHMRMHTSQHLISAIAWNLFSAKTVGNQIYSDRSHMDLRPASLMDDDLELIREDVNKRIAEDHIVSL